MKQETDALALWCREAINTHYDVKVADLELAKISYQVWSRDKAHSLLFVHGNNAHSHWWDHIAPAFSAEYNVAAINLFGMGDSDYLDDYSVERLVSGLLGVIRSWAGNQRPILVGHSFGGRICLKTKLVAPAEIGDLVLVDVPFYPPEHSFEWAGKSLSARAAKYYGSLDEAVAAFRFSPDLVCAHESIRYHIARHSFRKHPEGWALKSDPNLFPQIDYFSLVRDLPTESIDLKACIWGSESPLYTQELTGFNQSLLADTNTVKIPGAGHHVFLDQPLRFADALNDLLDSSS